MQQTVLLTLEYFDKHCELNLKHIDHFLQVYQKFSSNTLRLAMKELEKEIVRNGKISKNDKKTQLALMRNAMKTVPKLV